VGTWSDNVQAHGRGAKAHIVNTRMHTYIDHRRPNSPKRKGVAADNSAPQQNTSKKIIHAPFLEFFLYLCSLYEKHISRVMNQNSQILNRKQHDIA
jgi:hypothetical protein